VNRSLCHCAPAQLAVGPDGIFIKRKDHERCQKHFQRLAIVDRATLCHPIGQLCSHNTAQTDLTDAVLLLVSSRIMAGWSVAFADPAGPAAARIPAQRLQVLPPWSATDRLWAAAARHCQSASPPLHGQRSGNPWAGGQPDYGPTETDARYPTAAAPWWISMVDTIGLSVTANS